MRRHEVSGLHQRVSRACRRSVSLLNILKVAARNRGLMPQSWRRGLAKTLKYPAPLEIPPAK